MPETTFSDATAITADGPGRFRADIHPNWTIERRPNGGYLLAMLGRAATTVGGHPHVLAASVHYLAAPSPGAVTVCAEVLRVGRRTTQLRAWMSQNHKPVVEALLTTGTLDPVQKPLWDKGILDSPTAEWGQCVRLPAITPDGMALPILAEVDLRLDPAVLGFATGRPSGAGELRGWLELPGEDFDPISLLYAGDSFPPATFEIQMSGWVPTVELTVYVRAIPAPGPVRVLQRAQLIANDWVDEACYVWDSRGRLVAQATQLAGIRMRPGPVTTSWA
jgi:hypothetical protein